MKKIIVSLVLLLSIISISNFSIADVGDFESYDSDVITWVKEDGNAFAKQDGSDDPLYSITRFELFSGESCGLGVFMQWYKIEWIPTNKIS